MEKEWIKIVVDTPKWSFIKYKDNGKMDYPSPIPFTVNYGRAIEIKSDEGDDADVVVLGGRIGKGVSSIMPVVGIINFLDRGINDPKYICSLKSVSLADKINIVIFFTLFSIFKNVLNKVRGKKGQTKFKGIEIYQFENGKKPIEKGFFNKHFYCPDCGRKLLDEECLVREDYVAVVSKGLTYFYKCKICKWQYTESKIVETGV